MVSRWIIIISQGFKRNKRVTISMGVGSIYINSQKQKLNTISSTETKVVVVDDLMTQILWKKYFPGLTRVL